MSKFLDCEVFKGNNPLTGSMIWNQRVLGGSEVIKDKLKAVYNWDNTNNVASIAAKLKDESIDSWQLHLFGKSKGAKMDSSVFFMDQEEGNHMRIQEIDLDSLIFRNSLVSEWLSPDSYKWEYRLPHNDDPKKYHRVKKADMVQHNAKPLWLRALCQVVPGPKLQVFIGAAPAEDISELQGSTQGQFPLILVEKFSVAFLPMESPEMQLGMGPIPFLIDDREELEVSEVSINCPDGETIKAGMAQYLETAIKPNQRNEVKTWSKEVSVGNWVARAPNYTVPNPKPLEGDQPGEDSEEDTGQASCLFYYKGNVRDKCK